MAARRGHRCPAEPFKELVESAFNGLSALHRLFTGAQTLARTLESLRQAVATRKSEGERQKGLIRMRPPEITVWGMGPLTRASFTAQLLPPLYHFKIVPIQAA
jgi:hypothetical protein